MQLGGKFESSFMATSSCIFPVSDAEQWIEKKKKNHSGMVMMSPKVACVSQK